MRARGNFIDGAFVAPTGEALISRNPAADHAVVFETGYTVGAVEAAAKAAGAAQPAWAKLTRDARAAHLERWKAAISRAEKQAELADAIVLETGKIRSEAKAEAASLVSRFDLVRAAMDADLAEKVVGPGERLRYHALGVVGVIGPFNYPGHPGIPRR